MKVLTLVLLGLTACSATRRVQDFGNLFHDKEFISSVVTAWPQLMQMKPVAEALETVSAIPGIQNAIVQRFATKETLEALNAHMLTHMNSTVDVKTPRPGTRPLAMSSGTVMHLSTQVVLQQLTDALTTANAVTVSDKSSAATADMPGGAPVRDDRAALTAEQGRPATPRANYVAEVVNTGSDAMKRLEDGLGPLIFDIVSVILFVRWYLCNAHAYIGYCDWPGQDPLTKAIVRMCCIGGGALLFLTPKQEQNQWAWPGVSCDCNFSHDSEGVQKAAVADEESDGIVDMEVDQAVLGTP